MAKRNCWEFKECGREPGGKHTGEAGICPTATATELTGTNSGTCGGRACWLVSGTLCSGNKSGTFAQKQATCMNCDFFRLVMKEEGPNFILKK